YPSQFIKIKLLTLIEFDQSDTTHSIKCVVSFFYLRSPPRIRFSSFLPFTSSQAEMIFDKIIAISLLLYSFHEICGFVIIDGLFKRINESIDDEITTRANI